MNLTDPSNLKFSLALSLPSSTPVYNQVFQMKIRDLHIIESCVDHLLTVREVAKLFEQNQDWPGVILTRNHEFMGMLSRQRCFEFLARPYGIEIFSRKSLVEFLTFHGTDNLILDSYTTVQEAVKVALNRDRSIMYEPVVVRLGEFNYGLLTMHDLLVAQNDLLESLYNEVHQLSVVDPLTNLSNRRGFFEAAQPEIAASQVNHSDLSALMIDIDNFKVTNDLYGHFVGDQVIRAVADECQNAMRQTDLLGRFGGEEFIALLPNSTVETAFKIAERLRIKIENRNIFVNGFQVSVTISIGVCHISDAHGSLDALLTQADQAMYWAKRAGRNLVMKWDHNLAYQIHREINSQATQDLLGGKLITKSRLDADRIYDETIEGWAKALELRDKETEGHAQRVVKMTLALAQKLGIRNEDLVDIRRGALLHDIGKIAVPDNILRKPGPLDDEEWIIMRKHPIVAFELFSTITFLQKCIDIPYCHHEHWDGSGYPRGIRGAEIPLAARIFTIIDVWDALSTDRCYRQAWSYDEVRKFIVEKSGKLFDPDITPIFLKMLTELSDSDPIERPALLLLESIQMP